MTLLIVREMTQVGVMDAHVAPEMHRITRGQICVEGRALVTRAFDTDVPYELFVRENGKDRLYSGMAYPVGLSDHAVTAEGTHVYELARFVCAIPFFTIQSAS